MGLSGRERTLSSALLGGCCAAREVSKGEMWGLGVTYVRRTLCRLEGFGRMCGFGKGVGGGTVWEMDGRLFDRAEILR